MNHDPISVRLTLLGLMVVTASVSILHRSRAARAGDNIDPRAAEGTFMFALLRGAGLLSFLTIVLYIAHPAWLRWSAVDLHPAIRWGGAALSASAIPCLGWVFRHLGDNVTPTVVTRASHTLVTSGPYRWIRHPLYTFAGFYYLGVSLLTANGFFLALLVVGFAAIAVRTRLEETRLTERFGVDYRDYMARTGRFLPRLFRPSSA